MYILGEVDYRKRNLRYIAPEIASALIMGGTSIIGNMMNRAADEKMIEKQNAYNSPGAQMERMKAAGLNPNAVAQTIAGSAGIGNMAEASYDNMTRLLPDDLPNTMSSAYNAFLNGENTKAETENTKIDTEGKVLDNLYNKETLDARIQQALDEGAITEAQAEQARMYLEKYPEILDMTVEEQRERIDNIVKERERMDADIDRINQLIKESEALVKKYEQEVKTAKSQEDLNRANTLLVNEKTKGEKLQNEIQELRNKREELSGSATGATAVYLEKMENEGREAADEWLKSTIEIGQKITESNSEAAARGTQKVIDETPQGQLKKDYQTKMNNEIAEIDEQIARTQKMLDNESDPRKRKTYQKMIDRMNDNKGRVTRKYRNKMRRVDKGMSGGISVLGTGGSIGG